MSFTAANLLYFLIVLPPMCLLFYYLPRLVKKDDHVGKILVVSCALFFVRIMLVVFADSIGVMPYVKPELVLYSLLTIFGVGFSIFNVKYVEKGTFVDFGWHSSNLGKNVLMRVLGLVPLIAFLPIIYFSTHIALSSIFSFEKLVIASIFGLILGGFYEEVMFRGIIQYHIGEITTKNRTILYTALIFVLTHIGYLPFDAFGIYYWFLLLMALELSYLRAKFSAISCAVLHGGIVFMLILLV